MRPAADQLPLPLEAARVTERWAGQQPPGGLTGAYVKGALKSCQKDGCQAPDLAAMCRQLSSHTNAVLETLEKAGVKMEPTRALWCEQGDHSFSEKDPDMQVISMQKKGPDGEKVTESRTTCGKCAAIVMNRIGQAQNATAPASSPLAVGSPLTED